MNYKKITAVIAALISALSLYSCGDSQTVTDTPAEPDITLITESEPAPEVQITEDIQTDDQEKPVGDAAVFSLIDHAYIFSSDSEKWRTEISLSDDGSFEGVYQDSGYDTDENGFAVPVTIYCGFRGKFGKVKKVDDLTYNITLKELNTTDEITPKSEYIMKYTDQPYGLEDGYYYTIYLKGTEFDSLPEECQRWLDWSNNWEGGITPSVLPFDVLYNTSAEFAFCGTNVQETPEEPEKAEEVSDDPAVMISGSYLFETGIGDWNTTMELGADGSFTGNYHDTDYDTDEDGNAVTSTEYCSFSGKFSEPEKVDDLTYKITLNEISIEDTLPEDEEDEFGYYLSEYAFGLDLLEYTVYMKGTKTADLPEGCLDRISAPNEWTEENTPETIPFTVIYNETYDSTFAFIKS